MQFGVASRAANSRHGWPFVGLLGPYDWFWLEVELLDKFFIEADLKNFFLDAYQHAYKIIHHRFWRFFSNFHPRILLFWKYDVWGTFHKFWQIHQIPIFLLYWTWQKWHFTTHCSISTWVCNVPSVLRHIFSEIFEQSHQFTRKTLLLKFGAKSG